MFPILAAVSFSHLLNDMIQSLLPAIYPILKATFRLNFVEIGLITLTYQLTASLLQPFVGLYTDRSPKPFSLPVGMTFTLLGLLMLATAPHLGMLLVAAAFMGMGSSVFHPESSRVAHLASGGRHGLAQSVFQVGGNAGSSLGPLLAAFIVLPGGQRRVAWFTLAALLAILVLTVVGRWYRHAMKPGTSRAHASAASGAMRKAAGPIIILAVLVFSKYFYLASLTSYYTFYLMAKFHVPVRTAQIDLFIFLGAVAAGTVIGGPVGDRFGRKYVIWLSILGVLPFTLLLPEASYSWTLILTVVIGLILASAFSAILVYAQELVPGNVGMIAGLFFGFAFGMAGIGAAVLGKLADTKSIFFVYRVCSFLPALGLLTAFLPDVHKQRETA